MKFVTLHDTSRTANPKPDALRGYNLEQELRAAGRAAVKPISKKLTAYRSERARLEANVARWSPDSYNAKLNEVTEAAARGDESAAAAIESGAVASRQTFGEMHARAWGELDNFDHHAAGLFNEAADLIEVPMTQVVDKGAQILNDVLAGLGLEGFELTGPRNHVRYVLGQLRAAGRNAPADLQWFWAVAE
jgi:hypothetical protein